jgi:hypothetical protein
MLILYKPYRILLPDELKFSKLSSAGNELLNRITESMISNKDWWSDSYTKGKNFRKIFISGNGKLFRSLMTEELNLKISFVILRLRKGVRKNFKGNKISEDEFWKIIQNDRVASQLFTREVEQLKIGWLMKETLL